MRVKGRYDWLVVEDKVYSQKLAIEGISFFD
jgi:hypothetical protein